MSKKIAVIRGANLNKFEMQTYEPLRKVFDVEAFCIARNNFSLKQIDLPIHKLLGIEVFLPRIFERCYYALFNVILEMYQPMLGLQKKLKNFDILHIPEVSYYYSYQAAKAKRKYGLKMVSTCAANIPFAYGQSWLSKRRMNRTIKEVDLFLPLSQRAKEVLLLLGIPAEKIEVVPFGIDVDIFTPKCKDLSLAERFGLQKDDLIILFVGRINRSKGVYELVYAAKKIFNDHELIGKRIKFLLIGSGPAKRRIEKLIDRLNIRFGVITMDNVEYDLMPKIHNLADIFVLPSIAKRRWQEQFGMVLIESMACGKAVVAAQSGSIPEVVGEAGVLVQPNDPFSLAEAIKKLILDESLRQELGKRGRERAEANFSIAVVSRKLQQIYEKL
ncbi:MAG: glycosyltransferase family 4 protein [candidate division Zixibacteria bacterium]|nr:glycosyltransferase family 4 protein [candidate division Zixibacteria bacterium]